MSVTMTDESLVVDEESEQLLVAPPQAKSRRMWPLVGVGLLGVAFGTASFLKPKRPALTRKHLDRLRNSLLRAFDSDLMAEKVSFNSSGSFLCAAEGETDTPSTMKAVATMNMASEQRADQPTFAFSFKSVDGKQDDAKKGLEDFLGGILPMMDENEAMNPDGLKFSDMIGVENGDADTVSIVITLPEDAERQKKDIGKISDEMKKANPHFKLSLGVGRSFEDMIEHSKDPVMLLPNGIHLSGSFGIAGSLFEVLNDISKEPMPPLVEAVFGSITKTRSTEEIRYKKNSASMKKVPSVDDIIGAPLKDFLGHIFASIPEDLVDALSAMSENLESIAGIGLYGLPDNWEVNVEFTNLEIVSILKDGLEGKHGQDRPEWMSDENVGGNFENMEGSIEKMGDKKGGKREDARNFRGE